MKPILDIVPRPKVLSRHEYDRELRVELKKFAFLPRGKMLLGVFIIVSVWTFRSDSVFAPQPRSFSFDVAHGVSRVLTEEERELEEKLKTLESKIIEYDRNIQVTKSESESLKRDLSVLENRIKKINLQIQATDLQIRRISSRVRDTQSAIYESQVKISRQKDTLAKSLRAIYESNQASMLEILMANSSVADFFADLSAFQAIQVRAQAELDHVYALKRVLEDQESALLDAKEEQVALLLVQTNQKGEADNVRKAKDQLLTLTKGKEVLYQEFKKKAQKSAAEIRAQLYKLRGGGELRFEEAYQLAKMAGDAIGVRPALLLAVLSKESSLGRNVGRCSWRTAMHPTRDQPAYLQITQDLGIDPDSMLVSCPILSDGAYGGAMGIPQFLPSTWVLYKDRIKSVIGRIPSPWSAPDAFVATALYLADAGASRKTYEAERIAAAKYYAGGRWSYFLRSYGDRVMELAENFQEEINILTRTASL